MKLSLTKVLICVSIVVMLTSTAIGLWFYNLRQTSIAVMDSLYKYADYTTFLTNVRNLKDIMNEESYAVIDPDVFNNTKKYIRLSEHKLNYKITYIHVGISGDVIIFHKIIANKISHKRTFYLRLNIGLDGIYYLERGELLNL